MREEKLERALDYKSWEWKRTCSKLGGFGIVLTELVFEFIIMEEQGGLAQKNIVGQNGCLRWSGRGGTGYEDTELSGQSFQGFST